MTSHLTAGRHLSFHYVLLGKIAVPALPSSEKLYRFALSLSRLDETMFSSTVVYGLRLFSSSLANNLLRRGTLFYFFPSKHVTVHAIFSLKKWIPR